jgi:hypothetical protein
MSACTASAWPPAFSTSAAAVWIVPGNFGCGSVVFARDHNIGAVGGGAHGNGVADAARGAGNEEGPTA